MKQVLYAILSLTVIGNCFGQTLVANPQDSQYEGGELQLMNSNSNYNKWSIDNYQGSLRFHHDGSVYFIMNPNGNTGIGTSNPNAKFEVV
ncbi:MAG: hypothetical protein VXW38_11430, partial [Bacteroidota bacterium]|nr:hypothetical protein [Bacteroidota bacterium]